MVHKIVLVVEDELAIRMMLRQILTREGFTVLEAESVKQALARMADCRVDLLLLDWMLPDKGGLEFASELRRDSLYQTLPIIMLTARSLEEDKVRALNSGVDDYVTKPFSPRELIARVHAVLRRMVPDEYRGLLTAGRLQIHTEAYQITCDGVEVAMGLMEYKILLFLVQNADRVFSRSQLLDRVWDHRGYIEERTVDVHIRRLRRALEPFQLEGYIKTVRGIGYRFSVDKEPKEEG